MMMKNLILLSLFLLLITTAYAQNIRGKVLDIGTNNPLESVHVYLQNSKEGTFTDQKGKYILKLKSKINRNDSIYFSHVGFVLKKLPYHELKTKDFLIYLDMKKIKLEDVNLIVNRKLKSKINYQKTTSMKTERHSFASALVNGKIYVFGGDASHKVDALKKAIDDYPDMSPMGNLMRDLERAKFYFSNENYKGDMLVYDLKLNKWIQNSLEFRERAYHNVNYINDKFYVLGGKRLSRNRSFEYLDDKIEVFDLDKNIIEIDKTNPHQAVDFESFIYKGNLIVLGGAVKRKKNGKRIYTNKVHYYNIESGLWYQIANMPSAKETKGVLVDDRIYLFGGFNGKPLTSIESFDLISGKWKKEGDMFLEMSKPAITHNDNMIYLFENGKIFTYNIRTKELKQYFIGLHLKASKLHYANEKLYIVGGFKKDEFSVTPSSDIFSVDLDEFRISRVHKSKIL